MGDLSQRLPVGAYLIIEYGEYSEITSEIPVRVIREFIKQDVVVAYMQALSPLNPHVWMDAAEFLPWLISKGYVEQIKDIHSWHVGDYGFDP